MKLNKYYDKEGLKYKAKNKYIDKESVTLKWIKMCKQLNPGKKASYYMFRVLDLMSFMDIILDNILQDDFEPNKFIDNIIKLQGKMNITSDNIIRSLKKAKLIRNTGAHNTETFMDESIDYELCMEIFDVCGNLLNQIGLLDKEDINPGPEKLRAKTGDIVGECYLLTEYLGGGGGGKVYKATHQRLNITVAVKEINYDLKDKINIENEKNILLTIKHGGIPRIYDIFYDNQTVYLAMEYIDGTNLAELIEKTGPLPIPAALRYGLELCSLLLYLHTAENIIYNDLKPGNIILGTDNKLYIVDFGISCKLKSNDKNVHCIGSLGYSSPEQLNGDFSDERSDIYGLGGVLYYLIEGVNPPVETERKYSRNTPSYIIDLIEKCMAANPDNRFPNAQEVINSLNYALYLYENKNCHIDQSGKIKKKNAFIKTAVIICMVSLFLISAMIAVLLNNKNKIYTSTQFYKEDFSDDLKQTDKIVISPKHVYFKDSKLYMHAFVYNGYYHDIQEIKKIHVVLSSGNSVIAEKTFNTSIKNIKSNFVHEYEFIFEGSSIKNSNVDLSTLKWNVSFIRID